MVRIIVDSGSSIKQEEKAALGVEILPLRILLGGKEYVDGIDLSWDVFYHALIEDKQFPKTSQPLLSDAHELVSRCLGEGNEVLILAISSSISGTYQSLHTLFKDEPRVRVIDSKTAVGGIRILVHEAKKYANEPLAVVAEKVEALIPRIRVVAAPQTLEYLCRGGRLSKAEYALGSILQIKPLISLDSSDGCVKVMSKERGLKKAIQAIADCLRTESCDTDYPIVPSYTYSKDNLEVLISLTDQTYHGSLVEYDHLDPAIACHWGPGAFGYIFVAGNKE